MSKVILITGGLGFIGSHFILHKIQADPGSKLINLDAVTYAANPDYLKSVETHPNYHFVKGSIEDKILINQLFDQHQITDVIHFAAESHVDNSISGPEAFIKTNINGTFNLLHKAYQTWMNGPNQMKPGFETSRFHHISTDEVYGSLGETGAFSENTPYDPSSPYSASKAASDHLVNCYHKTYGLNVVLTNCSNNYGPHQHEEKLIPTVIRKALAGEAIPIYGTGQNIRDWLYVKDHCLAIDLVFEKGKNGQSYNIGTNCEKNNLELATQICKILDQKHPKEASYTNQLEFVKDRAGHDFRYAIDATKIKTELKWDPKYTFEKALEETVQWYLNKQLVLK